MSPLASESVRVEPVVLSGNTKKELDENLVMFFTGTTRTASKILSKQTSNTKKGGKSFENLLKMKGLALELKDSLAAGDLTYFGEILDKNWQLKKGIAEGISNSSIDSYYKRAIEAGALGGKILGGGGGGFLLFYCEKKKQPALKSALSELEFFGKNFENEGTKIIFLEE